MEKGGQVTQSVARNRSRAIDSRRSPIDSIGARDTLEDGGVQIATSDEYERATLLAADWLTFGWM